MKSPAFNRWAFLMGVRTGAVSLAKSKSAGKLHSFAENLTVPSEEVRQIVKAKLRSGTVLV